MTKISDLTPSTTLAGTEVIPVVQGGVTKKVTVSDLATATTLSKAAAGTNLAPSFSFSIDTDTGMYHPAVNTLGFATGGTLMWSINGQGSLISSGVGAQLLGPTGDEVNPGYSFNGNISAGMYLVSPNLLGFAANATLLCTMSSSALQMATGASIRLSDGTAPNPSLTFSNDSNTGLYIVSPDVLGLTVGGVLKLQLSTTQLALTGTLSVTSSIQSSSGGIAALGTTGALYITDGITAPSTTVGQAIIYVDTSDGDLKVKFGDGTVKTIVVDT